MIRTKLTIWNCAILALVLTAIGAATYLTTRQAAYKSLDDGLRERAHFFAASWHGGPPRTPSGSRIGWPPPSPPPVDAESARAEGIDPLQIQRIQVMNEALRPMMLGMDGVDVVRPERKMWDKHSFELARSGRENFAKTQQDGVDLRVMSVPLRTKGRVTTVAQLAVTMSSEEEQLARLARTLEIVLPLAVAAMLLTGVMLTRQALRPVAQIALAAENIEATNLDGRLPVRGKDEFAQLGGTFNSMLDRLQRSFIEKDEAMERQRQFTADASHELKTPLTAIRARTGIAMRKPEDAARLMEHIAAIDRAALLMNSVVQGLLLLAASDEGRLELNKETVTVQTLAEDAIASVDLSRHVVRVDGDPELKINADPAALTRVLVNLLENSARHTEEGKAISIKFGPEASSLGLTITVEDDGAGIPAEHVPLVFERFHRVHSSRERESGGSGLGLAIAKAIVEAHGGSIGVESHLGGGTRVTITLRAPQASPPSG